MAADIPPPHLATRGVIPPLVTPLDTDGEVDRTSLARLVEFQLSAGVDGIFVGGSSGEIALLDTAQRRTVIDVAAATVARAVPLLVGAVDTGTRRVIEHGRQAAELGADAVVVTAPFYVHPHADEIVEHFREVSAALPCPVVAYDIPSAVHWRLTPDIVIALAESELVVALKDSSGDLASFREIRRRLPDLAAFTGSELFADTAVSLGAAGIVPGLANVDPHGYVRLWRAAREGDLQAARVEQDRLAELFTIVSVADRSRIGATAGALGAFKAAMALRGIITGPATNTPLLPLDADETGRIKEILDVAGLGTVQF